MVHYFEHLERRLRRSWHKTVLSDFGGESFTGREISEQIVAIHDFLHSIGFTRGDKAVIYGNSSARWAMAFLAINTYEGVAVPILSEFRPENASNLAEHSEASVIFTDRASWEKMDQGKIGTLRYVVSLEDYSILWPAGEKYIGKYREGKVHFPKDNLDNLAVINYTSGTTSAPKGVMLTYGNLATNVQFALEHIPPRPEDRIVSMLPLAHMYGFLFEFLYPLCGGVDIWFLGKAPTPSRLSQALKEIKPYILITVPLVIEKIFKGSVLPVISKVGRLMQIPLVSNIVLCIVKKRLMTAFGGKVRDIVMGGAPLNSETERWLRKIGLPYTVGYGMTEAAPLLAFENWQKFAQGSCGKVADRCEIRIASEDPLTIPGEIQAKGANIMLGYWKNKEATDSVFTEDGWLRTGDSGIIDNEGNIYIRGRIKNMILSSNGQNIYPEDIESIANSVDGIQESLAISRESKLVILAYTSGETLADDTLERINSRLPAYSRVNYIEIVNMPFEKTPKMSIKRYLYS